MSAVRNIGPFDDLEQIGRALLIAVGEDPARDGLAQTPRRVAESLSFLTDGYTPTRGRSCGMRSSTTRVKMRSSCGTCRSTAFANIISCRSSGAFTCSTSRRQGHRAQQTLPIGRRFTRRLQLLERLTHQVAEAINEVVVTRGLGVIVEARPLCVEMRGVAKLDSDTVTYCLLGDVRDDPAIRAQFSEAVFGQLPNQRV